MVVESVLANSWDMNINLRYLVIQNENQPALLPLIRPQAHQGWRPATEHPQKNRQPSLLPSALRPRSVLRYTDYVHTACRSTSFMLAHHAQGKSYARNPLLPSLHIERTVFRSNMFCGFNARRYFLSRKQDTYTGLAPLVGARRASVRCRHTVEPKAGLSGSTTGTHNGNLKLGFSGSTN